MESNTKTKIREQVGAVAEATCFLLFERLGCRAVKQDRRDIAFWYSCGGIAALPESERDVG